MPYIIKRPVKKGISAVALVAAAMAVTAAPVLAGPAPVGVVDTSWCTNPLLQQPFLAWNDARYYVLAPGQSAGNFDGTGWTLTGGAQIVQATLADGSTGAVLDLPPNSSAISPPMCVTNAYPKARTMVLGSKGVAFAVSYEGTDSWLRPKKAGQVHGNDNTWMLSGNIDLHPADNDGWQVVRFVLTQAAKDPNAHDTQLYNFYVDPYAKR